MTADIIIPEELRPRDGRFGSGPSLVRPEQLDHLVSLGQTVVKANARKVRRLHHDKVLAGFAGATADATDTACEIVRPILVERQSTAAASSARFNKG